MTHLPRNESTPAREPIKPLDPDSPEGIAATEALSQVLAEVYLAISRRRQTSA